MNITSQTVRRSTTEKNEHIQQVIKEENQLYLSLQKLLRRKADKTLGTFSIKIDNQGLRIIINGKLSKVTRDKYLFFVKGSTEERSRQLRIKTTINKKSGYTPSRA